MEEKKETKQEINVKEMLTKIAKQQNEIIIQKKEKEWKMPFRARLSKGQVKKNFATFCVVQDNKEVNFIKVPINDGTAEIDGIPRIATANYALTYKGKPFYILPYWSLRPFSAMENIEKTEADKMNIAGRRLVLSKLEKEVIKPKGNMMQGKGWLLLLVAVVAGGYLIFKGGFF